MVTISFPGLGIEPFTVNPVAFTIPIFGGISVRWYGLIITFGIILAVAYCAYRAKQEGIIFDQLLDIAIFTIVFGILGARAYYVLTSLDRYDSFYSVIAIWEGGLAIYGGILAGAATIWIVCRKKHIKTLKMLDATAPAVMIGQILGRWGNFFNGEAHGTVVPENSPLYFIRMGLYPHEIDGVYGLAYVHPTFLYESLWNLLGFVLIHCLYKKKKFDGQIVLMYISWYGFGRMFIEGLRTDSLMVGSFRISQVVGFLCFVIGAVLLTVFLIRAHKKEVLSAAVASSSELSVSQSAETVEAMSNEESEKTEENKEIPEIAENIEIEEKTEE